MKVEKNINPRVDKMLKKPISISGSFAALLLFFSILSLLISSELFFKHFKDAKNAIWQKLQHQSGRIENTFTDAIEYTASSMGFISRQIADNNKWHDYNFIKNLLICTAPQIFDTLSLLN
jgi:hypothetical protein